MKCAFAGFWSALQMIRDAGLEVPGEIVMAGVVGEIEKGPVDEWQGKRYRGGGAGARFMLNHGVTADFCINGEPTGLRLQTGNAGYVFAESTSQALPSTPTRRTWPSIPSRRPFSCIRPWANGKPNIRLVILIRS